MSEPRTLREMMMCVDGKIGSINTEMTAMKKTMTRIDKTLHENGLIVQVDRNTQWRRSWRRHIGTTIAFLLLVVAIIAIIVQTWKESP